MTCDDKTKSGRNPRRGKGGGTVSDHLRSQCHDRGMGPSALMMRTTNLALVLLRSDELQRARDVQGSLSSSEMREACADR